jgi:hypothetical protein
LLASFENALHFAPAKLKRMNMERGWIWRSPPHWGDSKSILQGHGACV